MKTHIKHWLRQHRIAFKQTWMNMLRQPVNTLFNLSVISLTAAFPFTLWLVIHSLSGIVSQFPIEPQLTVFLQKDLGNVAELRAQLDQDHRIEKVIFVSKNQALEQMTTSTDTQDLLIGLDENPLPDALILTIKENNSDQLDALQKELKNKPGVDEIQLDSAWARKLNQLTRLCQIAVHIITILLAFAFALITANTIRMQILTRLDEIEVAKLIGAADCFIYRPFIHFSMLQGLLGGLLGSAIAATIVHHLNIPIRALAEAYDQPFLLSMPEIKQVATLCATTMTLSLLGSWLAVWRHLLKFL